MKTVEQERSTGGSVGLLLFDRDGRVIDHNETAQFLLGRSAKELLGHQFGQMPQSTGASFDAIEVNCVSQDGRVRTCELRIHRTVDGRLTPIDEGVGSSVAVAPPPPASPRPPDTPAAANEIFFGTLHDVTPYRDAAMLAQAELVQRDEFLATLSHELRNPLSAITSGFELLRQEELGADVRQETAAVMSEQLAQLRRLLDDLLDMTRLSKMQISLSESLLDLRAPVRAACRVSSVLYGESPSDRAGQSERLRVVVGDEPLPVKGDAARLEQLVANLIGNALKFTPNDRPVLVETSCVDTDDLRHPTGAKGDLNELSPGPCGVVQIVVHDEGQGIDPSLLPYLFDPFVQAQRTFGRSDGGFGIGLTLVRDIVSLHGGRVWAESEGLGQGATFIVQLPAADPGELNRASEARERQKGSQEVRSLSILLVEDVPAIRKVTMRLLQRIGHAVTAAIDAPTAIEAFANNEFDLALIDIGLPGPSGLVIAETIRREDRYADVKLVALTGYAQEIDRRASLDAGFDRHMVKPFDLREFHQLVEDLF